MSEVSERLIAQGREIAPDNPDEREDGRRVAGIDGVHVYFTDEEEAEATKAAESWSKRQADYVANRKYKDDRRAAYPPIGDQLDALWKGGDAEAAMKVIVDKVKSDNPKPE